MLCKHGVAPDATEGADNCAFFDGRRPHLAYHTLLPNYGRTDCARWTGNTTRQTCGGSREAYVFLQYILDFQRNLPLVTIFTQDDCVRAMLPNRRPAAWGSPLPVSSTATSPDPISAQELGCAWRRAPNLLSVLSRSEQWWATQASIGRATCLCSYISEPYRQESYYWASLMSVIQTRLLGQNLSTRAPRVEWPEDASFAVSRAALKAHPRWLYTALLRLFVVEGQCGAGSILWAHALERLWFEVLNMRMSDKRPLLGWSNVIGSQDQPARGVRHCLDAPMARFGATPVAR